MDDAIAQRDVQETDVGIEKTREESRKLRAETSAIKSPTSKARMDDEARQKFFSDFPIIAQEYGASLDEEADAGWFLFQGPELLNTTAAMSSIWNANEGIGINPQSPYNVLNAYVQARTPNSTVYSKANDRANVYVDVGSGELLAIPYSTIPDDLPLNVVSVGAQGKPEAQPAAAQPAAPAAAQPAAAQPAAAQPYTPRQPGVPYQAPTAPGAIADPCSRSLWNQAPVDSRDG